MWFQVNLYLPMRAMYILINRGKQGATMSRKKVSILCSHMYQESNTQLTRTREKPFTQAHVLTIRPPGQYKPTKFIKYDRLGGFTCALFFFWESQCGGELGQLRK